MRNDNLWWFNLEKKKFVFGVSQSLKVIISTIDAVSVK